MRQPAAFRCWAAASSAASPARCFGVRAVRVGDWHQRAHFFALNRSVAVNRRHRNAFNAHALRAIDAQPAGNAVDLEAQLAFHPDLRDSKRVDSKRVQPRGFKRHRPSRWRIHHHRRVIGLQQPRHIDKSHAFEVKSERGCLRRASRVTDVEQRRAENGNATRNAWPHQRRFTCAQRQKHGVVAAGFKLSAKAIERSRVSLRRPTATRPPRAAR